VLVIACDITDPTAVTSAIDQAAAHFGGIDVLINNAAIYHPFAFDEGSDALIRQHVEVNVLGLAWAIRAAIPYLRTTQGQIVSISSESVRMPFPMLALYAATKAAVEALSEGLRDELRSDGIRVSVLRSGSVSGGSGSDSWSDATRQKFMQKIVETGHAAMSGTPATPQSMAEALVAILALPRDVSVDLIELRAAQSGMPDGAKSAAGISD
jgi:NADP-dependent 3-hydroxy acid dehydrogenase YdfG